ncbi:MULTISPECIES: hypothetical protein [unclassified Streptomyces]|uniref:hypothetical protein n=1 Tax=unclassified Streptomyces TaxID=2593676 RepID=UPI0022583BA5|nr:MULTISPECIES: hypothetical protein [unclassified Streptomyces]WSP56027.1 hypothetical protein OG306_17780 [Streptomyces sp. NBC_01241]WSU23275.1 hypothetical protein OG508_21535 [Streptomyces sp. NBC_01108]MCX4787754.1 hypothetical protein [Streptomyces sp. NBC_01221]MCX4796500.1 hypothetical protein [Streptomyces sp. NBC_01242]WSJ37746.1 hypothetical protein OG772_18165 [Streptomyces sp. NBC_01321]
MIWYVLAVVLGLALIGAVAALIVTERRPRPPKPGRRPRPSKPVAASAAVVGREALDVVNAGLRRLTGECLRSGRSLPDLYAVVYSEKRLALLLAGAEEAAPAPWSVEADGERWTISPDDLHRPGPEGEPALPYALTVTVGLDGPDRVLVDLSRATGPVSVTGPDKEVRSLVRAVVTEALAGPVGALAEVTLVGSLADGRLLSGDELRTSRLHDAASLEDAFATVAASAGTGAPEPGSPDVTQIFRLIEGSSRIAVQGEAPHLFVVDASQLPRREGALAGLRRGDALLVVGEAPTGWRWRAGADGSLDTGPLGLEITRHAGRMA